MKNLSFLSAFFALILIFLISSCADRKRSNPLDPKNPETHGKPRGLHVYSELTKVYLSWEPVGIAGIRGYRIYRKTAADSAFEKLQDVGSDSTIFIDENVAYEVKYSYTITILGEDFESEPGDTVFITPGPTSIFVADVYNRHIFKLTHDCSHEIYHIPVEGYPWQLDYDDERKQIWFTDVLFNDIVRINLADRSQVILDTFYYGDPVDIMIDKKNKLVWAADEDSGSVHVFNLNGLKLQEIDDFEKISDINCFFGDGSCWVVDFRQKKLVRVKKNFSVSQSNVDFTYPFRISVNQSDGSVWVLDDKKLVKLNLLGKLEYIVDHNFNNPYALAVDSENGRVWVADWYSGKNNSKILCFESDGSFLFEKKGFNYPENIIANPENHGCIVADSPTGRVIKTDSQGNIIGVMENLYYPHGLVIFFER